METLLPAASTESAPKYSSATQKRVDHLITGTKAITVKTLGYKIPHGSTLRQEVLQQQVQWEEGRKGREVVKVGIRYSTLARRAASRQLPSITDYRLLTKKFRVLPSSTSPLEIRGPDGSVLAYRFCVPDNFIVTLEESDKLLPLKKPSGTGGSTVTRQYAMWADYGDLRYSNDYKKDLPAAETWREINQPFFEYLSNNLRMLSPEMWLTAKNAGDFNKTGDIRPVAEAWHGVVISQKMKGEVGKVHQDWPGKKSVYNAIVPYSSSGWTGGDLILWQLKLRVQVSRGEALFFLGNILAHEITEITEGERNEVDLFIRKSSFDRKEREQKKRGVFQLRENKKTSKRRKEAVKLEKKVIRREKKEKLRDSRNGRGQQATNLPI